MCFLRGSKGAYQKWADHVGDQSYTWENWLPYFKKSVRFSGPSTNGRPDNATAHFDSEAFAEEGGPVNVAYPYWTNAISSWVDKTLEALGFPQANGFSDGNLLGRSYITHTIHPKSRRRETSSTSYLREALMHSDNINIFTRTMVTKILFDESNKANAVALDTAGFKWKISANKEIILSAGVVSDRTTAPESLRPVSNYLLVSLATAPYALRHWSERGPRAARYSCHCRSSKRWPEHVGECVSRKIAVYSFLMEADRSCTKDTIILGPTSPVNLAAHSQLLGSKEVLGKAIHQYNSQRSGLLTNPGQDYFAFEKHPEGLLSESTASDIDRSFPDDWPTFSYIALDDSFVPQWNGKSYFSMSAVPLTPFSRGIVTINSTNALDHPIVDPRWLTDPRDRELVVAAFRRCRQFVATEPLSQVITGPEILPGPEYQTDEEILRYIAETSDAFYAGVGTCAMGKRDDPASVVDSSARVIGVQGLRVVDASAFPFSIDGQPMATVCKCSLVLPWCSHCRRWDVPGGHVLR
jgi:5'-oxoaverantin cyclase/versicolorin B synthase